MQSSLAPVLLLLAVSTACTHQSSKDSAKEATASPATATVKVTTPFEIPSVEYTFFTGSGVTRQAVYLAGGELYDQIGNSRVRPEDDVTHCMLSIYGMSDETQQSIFDENTYPLVALPAGDLGLKRVEVLYEGEGTIENGDLSTFESRMTFFTAIVTNEPMSGGPSDQIRTVSCGGPDLSWATIAETVGHGLTVTTP